MKKIIFVVSIVELYFPVLEKQLKVLHLTLCIIITTCMNCSYLALVLPIWVTEPHKISFIQVRYFHAKATNYIFPLDNVAERLVSSRRIQNSLYVQDLEQVYGYFIGLGIEETSCVFCCYMLLIT